MTFSINVLSKIFNQLQLIILEKTIIVELILKKIVNNYANFGTYKILSYRFFGQVACIVFTPGCNFRCEFCHNSEFVLPKKLKSVYKNLIPLSSVFDFLEKRKWLLTGVSICWGELTLQKWPVEFCRKVKEMWFLVKLDTNWGNPEVLKDLLDKGLVDYVALDIKKERMWKLSQ